MKNYILMHCINYEGDTVPDVKILGTFKTLEEAKLELNKEIQKEIQKNGGYDDLSFWIEEIEIKI